MGKKRYYDDEGNEIRSRPSKPFYQKWWVILLITLLGVGIYIIINLSNEEGRTLTDQVESESVVVVEENVGAKSNNPKVSEAVVDEDIGSHGVFGDEIEKSTYTYEDFKGTYVAFEGIPYESAIEHVVFLEENSLKDATMKDISMDLGVLSRNIIDRTIEEDILYLDWMHTSAASSGTLQTVLEYQDNYKVIQFEGEFNLPGESFYSMSEQDLLDNYDTNEIDYARIMLMTGIPRVDPTEPYIEVNQIQGGEPIYNIKESPVYPENVIKLTSMTNNFSNHDVYSTVYSVQGGGYITLYPEPSNFEIDIQSQSDEDYHKLADEILKKAETVYVDPSEPYLVADFIARIEFIY